jgi:catalase
MRKIPALLLLVAALAGAFYFVARPSRENPVPENEAIETIAADAVAALAEAYPTGEKALVRRAAHAKAHGCVKATFRVDPALPENLRIGTFAEAGQRFKAVIRFSNSAFKPGPDRDPGGRGMALKLIDADPDRPDPSRRRPPHDILFINYPIYFLANIEDFSNFMQVGGIKGDMEHAKAYFLPGENPFANPFAWRLRELSIVYRNANRKISSPLRADYFSMTPYGFGPGRAIKYAAKPCVGAAGDTTAREDPDYLRKALTEELKGAPACFELFAQERTADIDLDDATQDWPLSTSPLLALGRIDIPPQDVAAAGRDALCENLSYNPGNAPTGLEPLGGINRARMELYNRAATYRFSRNGAAPTDAAQAWERF